jgi:hypothetical protein
MQQNDTALKKRYQFDGEEIPGLVNAEEVPVEEGTIEVPELFKTRNIKNGVTKIPLLQLTYKIGKDTNTLKFFQDWKDNNETKNVTEIHVDAHGTELRRVLYPDTECAKYTSPAYDAANPTYNQTAITLVPYDVINL